MKNETSNFTPNQQQDSEHIRRTVHSMLDIIEAEETSYADRKRASTTIRSVLLQYDQSKVPFSFQLNQLEIREASGNRSVDYSASVLDTQEAKFADRLKELMKAKAITQLQLATRVGCSQPAISQMLNRQCRPQRSTILNLAAALDVEAHELWPNLDVTDVLDTVAAVQEESEMSAGEADAIRRTLEMPPAKALARNLPSRKK
jgi:transcriptional regulator with XRE-family HTH domain